MNKIHKNSSSCVQILSVAWTSLKKIFINFSKMNQKENEGRKEVALSTFDYNSNYKRDYRIEQKVQVVRTEDYKVPG